jgi:hypothetical protein
MDPEAKRQRRSTRTITILMSVYEGPLTAMASLAIMQIAEIIADSFSECWIKAHALDVSFLKDFHGKTLREFLREGDLETPLSALLAFSEGAYC